MTEPSTVAQYGEPIVVVSGLPRSGTSMMMGMLQAGGLTTVKDGLRVADPDNPKGYHELERVKTLDKPGDKSWVRESRGHGLKVISFLLKDLPDDNYYKVLFMRREIAEVLASQREMLIRRGEPTDAISDEKMTQLYQSHLKKVALMLAEKPNFESMDIPYREAMEGARAFADRVVAFLGMDLDAAKMAEVVDQKLYRNRK